MTVVLLKESRDRAIAQAVGRHFVTDEAGVEFRAVRLKFMVKK
jgi:hypothetical protein